jgi:eukaryotic-like serine/threonine-protein kinase
MTNLIEHNIGRYHILEQLGEGGMAIVYKAYDTRLECDVAIKVIRADMIAAAFHERMFRRFEREAKSLAKLTHPNIVGIIDYGEYDGSPYLVMPYLPGGTLKERTGLPMPYKQAAQLLLPIARALQFTHSKGILHRDVKPSNILLSESGEPMLGDFGVARIMEAEKGSTLTGTGVGVGTPEYMSPEQARGLTVDARSDVYALGVVFYELITGRCPYEADTPMAVALKQASDPLPRAREFVPGLPGAVEKVLFKALAKKPEDRYADMGAFAEVLEKLARGAEAEKQKPANTRLTIATPKKMSTGKVATHDDMQVALEKPAAVARVTFAPSKKGEKRRGIWMAVGGALLVVLVVSSAILVAGWIHSGKDMGEGPLAFLATHTPTLTLTQSPSHTPTKTYTPPATNTPSLTPSPTNTTTPLFTATPVAGATMISPNDGMTMVYVPEGEFTMGSANNDMLATDYEKPQRNVYLNAYWIDQTEITNTLFANFLNNTENNGYYEVNGSLYQPEGVWILGNVDTGNRPITGVTWEGANAYCNWAGRRLPTEAEWEKAARGTDERIYPWGNDLDCTKANFSEDNGFMCIGHTTSVGDYPSGASPYGALDMAGNVLEWVNDWWQWDEYSEIANIENPGGPSEGDYKVLRGGAWYSQAPSWYRWGNRWIAGWAEDYSDVRVTARYSKKPDESSTYIGFRCVFQQNTQTEK